MQATDVYRRLPHEVRAKLDSIILTRPEACPTVQDAFRSLNLDGRFGLRLDEVKQYADALEAFARPFASGIAVAALLDALPKSVVRQLSRANRLLVWSRLVQQMTDPEARPFSASEFTKLAELLGRGKRSSNRAGTAERRAQRSRPPGRQRRSPTDDDYGDEVWSPEMLAPLVRELYGVNLATDIRPGAAAPNPPSPGDTNAGRAPDSDQPDKASPDTDAPAPAPRHGVCPPADPPDESRPAADRTN